MKPKYSFGLFFAFVILITLGLNAPTFGVWSGHTVVSDVEIKRVTPVKVKETYVNPFTDYIEANSDFEGWIEIGGTSIDDPLVKGLDNEHYLNYDYLDKRNSAGALFLDYRNQGNFYDNHMVIYGHYMQNGTKFHDLHLYKDKEFLENNSIITLKGLRETKEYEIVSVQIVSAYTYYLILDLVDEGLEEYIKAMNRASIHEVNIEKKKDLKLLTLVTCTYEFDNARLLIHAIMK
jgi:sortase B